MMVFKFKESVAEVQVQFLEDLGIYQRGYAPPGAVGNGRSVVFDNIELKQRLSLAGFNGAVIRTWMLGSVSMTTRTMLAVIRAANGGVGVRFPTAALRIEGKKVRRSAEVTPAGITRYIQGAKVVQPIGPPTPPRAPLTGHIELRDGPPAPDPATPRAPAPAAEVVPAFDPDYHQITPMSW